MFVFCAGRGVESAQVPYYMVKENPLVPSPTGKVGGELPEEFRANSPYLIGVLQHR